MVQSRSLEVKCGAVKVQCRGSEGESRTWTVPNRLIFKVHGLNGKKETPVSWLGNETPEFLSSFADCRFFAPAPAGEAGGQVVVDGLRFLVPGAGGVFDGVVKDQGGG